MSIKKKIKVNQEVAKSTSFPNIYASINGKIYKRVSDITIIELVQYKNSKGYKLITINGSSKLIHRIVCEAFNGPIPEGYVVNHIDGDKANNNIENLEAITQKQNIQHAYNTGLISNTRERVRVIICDENHKILHICGSKSEAARVLGVSVAAIDAALKGLFRVKNKYLFKLDYMEPIENISNMTWIHY